MAGADDPGQDRETVWPESAFWTYSLDLYGRDGVEATCLSLQDRKGLDVNLLLWALWLGSLGIALDRRQAAEAEMAIAGFRADVVQPLRTIRRHLKALDAAEWSAIVEAGQGQVDRLRRTVAAAELDGEHLIQLALDRRRAGPETSHRAGIEVAASNLRAIARFDDVDQADLRALLTQAFPRSSAMEIERASSAGGPEYTT